MADRYFNNDMPDFVAEIPAESGVTKGEAKEVGAQGTQESLMRLLSMPYHSFSERLKRAALDLKETVVNETWGLSKQNVQDFGLYTGTLGTAFLLFKSYQVTNNRSDLDLSFQIVKACDSASSHSEHVTFFGRAGVCALGAVISKNMADTEMLDYYLTKFKEVPSVRN